MKTRAALMTPGGTAGLAVIQIKGPESLAITGKIFKAKGKDSAASFTQDRLIYGNICEGREIIDKVVIAADAQRQTVDINCHGGQRIVQRIMLLLKKHGVEIGTWQELISAESIAGEVEMKLPEAKTRRAMRAIASQYPGGLAGWCGRRIEALQKGSAFLPKVKSEAKELLSTYRLGRRLLNAPTVVITGPVNVGKSTLANSLTGKKQSITADLPGTTRDWTGQLTDMQGLGVNLIDTAGRRETSDEIEKQALEQADKQLAEADLILLVVEPAQMEQELIERYQQELPHTADMLIVVNKIDLKEPARKNKKYLYVSAREGTNLEQLRQAVAARFGFADFDPTRPLVFTERQFYVLTEIVHAFDMDHLINGLKELLGK